MLQIKKISIGSAFNVGVMFTALYWIAFGLLFVLLPAINPPEPSMFNPEPPTFGQNVATYFIGIPLSAIFGGIGAAIFALLYNISAKWTGGLQLEVGQASQIDHFMQARNAPTSQPTPATSGSYPPIGGRTDNMAKLQEASALIKAQNYRQAHRILINMGDHPTAQKWLTKLYEIDPTLRPANYRNADVDDWSPVKFD